MSPQFRHTLTNFVYNQRALFAQSVQFCNFPGHRKVQRWKKHWSFQTIVCGNFSPRKTETPAPPRCFPMSQKLVLSFIEALVFIDTLHTKRIHTDCLILFQSVPVFRVTKSNILLVAKPF